MICEQNMDDYAHIGEDLLGRGFYL